MDLFHLCFPYIPVTWRYTTCRYRQQDVCGKAEWLSGCSVHRQGGHANGSMELLGLHPLGTSATGNRTKLTSAWPATSAHMQAHRFRDMRLCREGMQRPGSKASHCGRHMAYAAESLWCPLHAGSPLILLIVLTALP